MKQGTLHWKDTDWQPEPETYRCACGCGESVTWVGIGRKKLYVSDAHRKRYMRQNANNQG